MNLARACSSGERRRKEGYSSWDETFSSVTMRNIRFMQILKINSAREGPQISEKFQRNRQAHCIVVKMALKLCVHTSRTSGQFSEYHQSYGLFGLQCTKNLTEILIDQPITLALCQQSLIEGCGNCGFKNLENQAFENGFGSLDVS